MKIFLSIALLLFASPFFAQVVTLEADIIAGASGSNPEYLTVYNGKLYFAATDGAANYGTELYSFDGTSVQLEADIYPGNLFSSQPRDLYVYNNKLYFSAIDGVHGRELWVHDGDSTWLFKDFDIDQNGNPEDFQEYNGLLYFQAYQIDPAASYGIELFATDGDSVWLVEDIYPGNTSSDPKYLTVFDNKLFFRAVSNNDLGYELYSYNGDSAKLEADIAPGISSSSPLYLTAAGSNLYFSANVSGIGRELFKFSDSTATLASDIYPGTSSSNPSNLTAYNGEVYFRALNSATGYEIWNYDGSTITSWDLIAGSATSNPRTSYVYKNTLFISLDGCATNYGLTCNLDDLISFDGDTFKNVTNHFNSNLYPQQLTEYDGLLFFTAGNTTTGRELWSYTPDSVCTTPKNLSVTPLTLSSVKLNWNLVPNAMSYEIRGTEVGTSGFVTLPINDGLTTSYQAKGLISNKTYAWQIRSVCDSANYSDWSGFDTFKIDNFICNTPVPATTDITNSSAILRWTNIPSANGYRIIGKDVQSINSIVLFIAAPQDSLFVNLAPNRTYVWQIRAECGGNSNSLFTAQTFFSTPAGANSKSGLHFPMEDDIRIFPNPTSEFSTIESSSEIKEVLLYDVQGRLIKSEQPFARKHLIERGLIAAGVYHLLIRTASGEYREKWVLAR